jgi:hypothetical protein
MAPRKDIIDKLRPPERRGGKREGAGRRKGSKNKNSAVLSIDASLGTKMTPLDFMLHIVRNPKCSRKDRMDMAKAAAPYVHAKLGSLSPPPGGGSGSEPQQYDLTKLTDVELEALDSISRKIGALYGAAPSGDAAPAPAA